MRRIDVVDGLSIRFPNRSAEFAEGVEIGLIAAALAPGWATIEMRIGPNCFEQARDLAKALGYRIVHLATPASNCQIVTFANGAAKARLRSVR